MYRDDKGRVHKKDGEYAKKPGRKPQSGSGRGKTTKKSNEMYGEGFVDGLKSVLNGVKRAHDYVKENKLISRGASVLAPLAGPYSGHVQNVGAIAAQHGYGKKTVVKHKKPRRTPISGSGKSRGGVVVLSKM
jgi:hypothetical protein